MHNPPNPTRAFSHLLDYIVLRWAGSDPNLKTPTGLPTPLRVGRVLGNTRHVD